MHLELCKREEQSQLGFVESRSCQRRVVPSALRNERESRVLEVDSVLLTVPQKTFSCWMCKYVGSIRLNYCKKSHSCSGSCRQGVAISPYWRSENILSECKFVLFDISINLLAINSLRYQTREECKATVRQN